MPELPISSTVSARSLAVDDAPELLKCVLANRAHLNKWLRWSSKIQTNDDARDFITKFQEQEAVDNGFCLGLYIDGELIGGSICWHIRKFDRSAEIGYWLDANHTGNGYATIASKAVMAHLFWNQNVTKIEMKCADENRASRAVAGRCGLIVHQHSPEFMWITDRYVQHSTYSITFDDWKRQNSI